MVRFYLHIFASAALSFLSAMKKVFISCAPSINYFCNCETNVFFFSYLRTAFRFSPRIVTFFPRPPRRSSASSPRDHATLPDWRNTHFRKVRGKLRRLYGGGRDFFQRRRRGEDQVVVEEEGRKRVKRRVATGWQRLKRLSKESSFKRQ